MSKIRVLIIEDDIRISEINKMFTERIAGYDVCGIATSIRDAMDMLAILEPDLVLLDLYFPDGHGSEILWHIREHHRNVDVIMITAAKEIDAVQEAIRGGAIDYIIKPIIFERFYKTMSNYQEYRSRVAKMDNVEQHDVDHLFRAVRTEERGEKEMPKGIDRITLNKIESQYQHLFEQGVTAEELAKSIGVSRTTARRYLEYMVSVGSIFAELAYGSVGRPERRYYGDRNNRTAPQKLQL